MQNARPTNIMDRRTCLWANVFDVTHFFLWTSHIDELGVCLFYYTISCSLVHMDHLRECVVWHHFPGRTYLMSTVRCATCHNFIDNQSRRFIFSRGKPRVISQLVMSFRVPRSTAYKQWNPPSTLHISKIFLPDTSHLKPRLEVPPCPQPSSILELGILSFLVFRFSFNIAKKCLFLRLMMAQKQLQTNTMILVVALPQQQQGEFYGQGVHFWCPQVSFRSHSRTTQEGLGIRGQYPVQSPSVQSFGRGGDHCI